MKITKTQQKTLNKKLFELDLTSPSLAIDIEKLLDSGADVNALDSKYEETPLHKIARTDNLAAVNLLLNRGADPLRTNKYSYTALHYAAISGETLVVELLLKYNPSEQVLHKSRGGLLALHHAANYGHTSLVECLLKINSLEQVLHKSESGKLALHHAAHEGKASVIEVFLNHLPIDQHLEMYQSALESAKKNDHANCIAVIEQALLQNSVKNSDSSQEESVIAIKNRNRL